MNTTRFFKPSRIGRTLLGGAIATGLFVGIAGCWHDDDDHDHDRGRARSVYYREDVRHDHYDYDRDRDRDRGYHDRY